MLFMISIRRKSGDVCVAVISLDQAVIYTTIRVSSCIHFHSTTICDNNVTYDIFNLT